MTSRTADNLNPWQPIETASKTPATYVDLWVVRRTVVNGEVCDEHAHRSTDCRWVNWASGVDRWIDAGGNNIEYHATETEDGDTVISERRVTHWMPLPAPPESDNHQQEGRDEST